MTSSCLVCLAAPPAVTTTTQQLETVAVQPVETTSREPAPLQTDIAATTSAAPMLSAPVTAKQERKPPPLPIPEREPVKPPPSEPIQLEVEKVEEPPQPSAPVVEAPAIVENRAEADLRPGTYENWRRRERPIRLPAGLVRSPRLDHVRLRRRIPSRQQEDGPTPRR